MKHILSAFILLVASSAFAQKIYTRNDSIAITKDSVTITASPHRGNIQWQKSLDMKNWINIEGKTTDSLKIKPDTESMYRAKVVEGSCLPVYSDSVAIIISDSIPKDYVNPTKTGLILVSDSSNVSKGNYIYTGTNINSDFEIGKVIIDEQSGGTIRRITDIIKISDTISVKTEQATMEDLFIGTSFKLSTDMIQPDGLKSAKTNMDISKVLTDKDGFIHPYEITYRTENGVVLKSVKVDDPRQFGENMHIKKDLTGQEFYKDGPARVYVSEGWIEFTPVFKFEFEFDRPKVDWNNLKINKGEIKKFKFWSDKSKFDFKTMITSEITYSMNLEATRMLLPSILNVSFTFMVGPVPVIIDATCDLMAHYDLNFDGSATATTGFQATRYITLGTSYENNQWTTWNEFTKSDTFFPLTFTANLNFKQRAEIYPHFAIRLYKMIGPYFDVIPYLKAEENLDIINETWDASVDLGLDGRIGANIEVLGEELAGLPEKEFNMLNYNVFKAPAKIEAISGNDQEGKRGELLPQPIKIKVTNSLSNTLSAFPVFFSTTNGSVDKWKVLTNQDGIATVNWTLDQTDETKTLRVYLKDGNGENRTDCELDITATVPTILPGSAPISVFTTSSTSITKGQSVQFTDKSINNPTSWYWTFGDGTTSTEQNPSKEYNTVGIYTVSLIAANSFGNNSKVLTNCITVSEAMNSNITGTFTDSRDGRTYNWVKIGTQTWMAENLAYLPVVHPPTSGSFTESRYYVYDYNGSEVAIAKQQANFTTYGVLYNWSAANVACPLGWHLPSDDEWKQLEITLGMTQEQVNSIHHRYFDKGAQLMKATSGWNSNGNGTNSSGFNAMPAGIRDNGTIIDSNGVSSDGNGAFENIGDHAFWWNSTERDADASWFRRLDIFGGLLRDPTHKNYGLSVRCIKDK